MKERWMLEMMKEFFGKFPYSDEKISVAHIRLFIEFCEKEIEKDDAALEAELESDEVASEYDRMVDRARRYNPFDWQDVKAQEPIDEPAPPDGEG